MAILPIHTWDDDTLRRKAEPVSEDSEELQQLIDDMFDTMYNAEGVGLAAPQVGRFRRIFVMDADPMTDDSEQPSHGPLVMINPEIIVESEERVEMDEGCLSIPGVNGMVARPKAIRVTFLDRNFEEQTLEVEGWMARVIQHEKDHLDGILFLDHLSLFKRKLLGARLREIAEGRKETAYPLVKKKIES